MNLSTPRGSNPMVLAVLAPRYCRRPDSVDPMQQAARPSQPRIPDDLSELDLQIVERLQEDGRRPFTRIASELGVSEAAVRARTNRLIERGVLQIVGVADPLKLGYDQMALVGVRCEGDRLLEAAAKIAELPEVIYVVVTAGAFDLLVETVCQDNEALLHFLAERLRKVPGVMTTETFVYLRIVKQSYHWGSL
ncbi:MAG: Lrp/AsnC family transcriptional regulator, regulator for asnA, asnC and gidA [Chloroflexota bacterium]|nr:Lrp/AsnC family transcriptional regulator, regulator for asnA, asnC and gidA [Chloroflexota bacterium]